MDACAEVAGASWEDEIRLPKEFDSAFIEFYRRRSTWTQVVAADGEPIGLLFGRIERETTLAARLRARLFATALYVGIALGRLGRVPDRLTVMRTAFMSEWRAGRRKTPADAEITLLFLSPNYQGRSIGKDLVENFLAEARRRDASTVNVVTSEDSNWRFYERLGFKRVAEFYDDFDSYLMKTKIMGFIYVKRL